MSPLPLVVVLAVPPAGFLRVMGEESALSSALSVSYSNRALANACRAISCCQNDRMIQLATKTTHLESKLGLQGIHLKQDGPLCRGN